MGGSLKASQRGIEPGYIRRSTSLTVALFRVLLLATVGCDWLGSRPCPRFLNRPSRFWLRSRPNYCARGSGCRSRHNRVASFPIFGGDHGNVIGFIRARIHRFCFSSDGFGFVRAKISRATPSGWPIRRPRRGFVFAISNGARLRSQSTATCRG